MTVSKRRKRDAETIDVSPDQPEQSKTAEPLELEPQPERQLQRFDQPGTTMVSTDPNQMLATAIDRGYSPEMIEKMMDLRDRHEATEARKAYTVAMSQFKENPPKITKNKLVDFTGNTGKRTTYRHASLDHVCDQIGAALAKVGISYRWDTEQEADGRIKVTCILTHAQGHKESVWLRGSPDDSGNKNSLQAIGSATSYLMRYTLLLATGMATADMDDDARGAGKEVLLINQEQAAILHDLIEVTESDNDAFHDWLEEKTGTRKVSEIPAKHYRAVHQTLKKKEAKRGKK